MTGEMKQKKFFDVRVEIITPIEVVYKVFAYDAEEAMKMVLDRKVLPRIVGKPKRLDMIKRISVFISGTVHKLIDKIL